MEIFNLTFFGEVLTFVALLFVTVKYVWPPIMKAINERQKEIAEGLAAAERGRHDLELAQKKAVQILEQAKIEAEDMLNKAMLQVNSVLEHGKSQARKEGERILSLAQADIESEKAAARQDLKQELSALVLLVTQKFLHANIDKASNKNLLEKLMQELQNKQNGYNTKN